MDDRQQAVKQWLQRYREFARDSEAVDTRLEALRSKIGSARTSSFDGMPHATGFVDSKTEINMVRLERLEQEAAAARAHALELYRERDNAIGRITGPGWPDLRVVLRVRYLDLEQWEGVAEVLFGQRDDYEDRQESFIRRVHKIHGAALAALAELVPLDEGQEIT